MSRNPRGNTGVTVLLVMLILLFAAGSVLMIWLCLGIPDRAPEQAAAESLSLIHI